MFTLEAIGVEMTKRDLSAFGRRVKALREQAGLSQQELATKAGLSLSVEFQIEQGKKRDPKLSTLLALAEALGKEAGQLVDELTRPAGGRSTEKKAGGRLRKGK